MINFMINFIEKREHVIFSIDSLDQSFVIMNDTLNSLYNLINIANDKPLFDYYMSYDTLHTSIYNLYGKYSITFLQDRTKPISYLKSKPRYPSILSLEGLNAKYLNNLIIGKGFKYVRMPYDSNIINNNCELILLDNNCKVNFII